MHGPRLCLIEDDPIMGESLSDRLGLEGFGVDWYQNGADALRALGTRQYAAVISDLRLPDLSGEEVFHRTVDQKPLSPPFVFITAFATVEQAVELLKQGAADFVSKPFDINALVEKIRGITGALADVSPIVEETVLGISPAARKVCENLERIAKRAPSVLITGESGVGKEVLARHIHALASAGEGGQARPFVAVNCGALPEGLVEAEFFGFERGAFTGAERAKRGFFEQANGGTLFLDEIGDLPLPMQVKLLRALQERRVKRLGAEEEHATSFQLLCATNKDLQAEVAKGAFREDLFYRVNLVHLHIPPLRERPEDILWLANKFVTEICGRQLEGCKALHPLALASLIKRKWQGNVRELKNVIERACILASGSVLGTEDFESAAGTRRLGDAGPDALPLDGFLAGCERAFIVASLQQHGGRIVETARALGISRKNLWEKMRKHDLGTAGP
ncbi:MAG TPA: sigma-54 dependent transcriptional regulator [Burkholderiales bacterium]|nr:sigma-54 dependent transcriptional regulator [Burkholderiales bacterium]